MFDFAAMCNLLSLSPSLKLCSQNYVKITHTHTEKRSQKLLNVSWGMESRGGTQHAARTRTHTHRQRKYATKKEQKLRLLLLLPLRAATATANATTMRCCCCYRCRCVAASAKLLLIILTTSIKRNKTTSTQYLTVCLFPLCINMYKYKCVCVY